MRTLVNVSCQIISLSFIENTCGTKINQMYKIKYVYFARGLNLEDLAAKNKKKTNRLISALFEALVHLSRFRGTLSRYVMTLSR